MSNPKTVIYGATRNIYRNVVPCVRSLVENGNIDEVVLLIEDNAFPYELPCEPRIINVKGQPFFDINSPNATKRWTYMTLMKAAASKLMPDLDRALILDCDTIVTQDISALWDLDMTGYYYGAVKQPTDGREGQFSRGADYFNCGVLLCNLEALRDGTEDRLIEALNTIDYEFPEQDCINKLCEGHILPLEGRYNTSDFTIKDGDVYIIHFAANSEWRELPEARIYDGKL